jgi:WXG100 family type VII secretion target
MTAFVADLPMLQEIVDRIAAFETTLDAQLDALDVRARRVRSAWNGAAADEYAAAHEAWAAGARETHAALMSLRRIAATAHGNYAQAVSVNRAMWP